MKKVRYLIFTLLVFGLGITFTYAASLKVTANKTTVVVGNTVTVTVNASGADRIRHIAGGHLFQVYKSALSGSFETICASTVPVNMLAIH